MGHHTYLILVSTTVLCAGLVLLQFMGSIKLMLTPTAGLTCADHLSLGILYQLCLPREEALCTLLKWRKLAKKYFFCHKS